MLIFLTNISGLLPLAFLKLLPEEEQSETGGGGGSGGGNEVSGVVAENELSKKSPIMRTEKTEK